jgi:plastocyanin
MYDKSSLLAAARSRQQKGIDMYKKTVAAGLALAALTLAPYSANAAKSGNKVRIEDRCEPVSFNAALQDPNACVGGGTTTFDEFLEELNPVDFGDHHWRFKVSGGTTIRLGQSISVVNNGGEAHTFTEVAVPAGGCIPFLNEALGEPGAPLEPAPECADPAIFPGGVIGPLGGTATVTPTTKGTHHFICLIHPWMRTDVTVK